MNTEPSEKQSPALAVAPCSPRFEIEHQQQPDDDTCNQTCLAMLLGVPVADVIHVFGGGAWSTQDMHRALERCRVWWNQLTFDCLMLHGFYLAGVPSLNHEAGGHCIIIQKDENGETIWDPQAGKDGKKWYGPNHRFPGGVNVLWKPELIYVCKKGWGSNWYNGHLPANVGDEPRPGARSA